MTPRFTLALILLAGPAFAAIKPAQPHAKPPTTLRDLPNLGDPAPASLLKSARLCDTGDRHHEPCARVRVGDDLVTLAWDTATRHITFLYSTTLVTDSDLAAGGVGRIDASMDIRPFLEGFVSPGWCDTDADLSGDALWCAVMKPARRLHGRMLGFVQSAYLPFSPDDPADIPLVRIARHGGRPAR